MLRHAEPSVVLAVVDDTEDDELAATVAREGNGPSEHFAGLWGSGQKDGNWFAPFRMIQLGGSVERVWCTSNLHRDLLEAILDVPHYVAVMPAEIAGDATTLEAMIPRLGGAVIVKVDHRSADVEAVLAERDESH